MNMNNSQQANNRAARPVRGGSIRYVSGLVGALLFGTSLPSAFAQTNQYYDTAQANLGWSSSSSVLDWAAAAGTPPYSNSWTNGNIAILEGTAGAMAVDAANPPTVGGIQPTVTGYSLSGDPINWVNGGSIYFPSNNVTLTISSVIADSAGPCSVVASGGAGVANVDVALNGLNTFSGGFTLDGCSVDFNTLDVGGNPSSFGVGTSIQFGTGGSDSANSTMNYTGNGGGTDRSIQIATMGTATIKNNGYGAILFTNAGNVAVGSVGPRSLALGGNLTGQSSVFAESINDLGTDTNVTSLTVNGAKWFIPQSNSYSGGTFLGGSSYLVLTNDVALGNSSNITFTSFAVVQATNLGAAARNDVTISSWRTITINSNVPGDFQTPDTNNLIVAAHITGPGKVIKKGSSYALGIVRFTCDTNDYTGDFSVEFGNTEFTSVANIGVPSSLGAGTNIILGNNNSAGMLRYIGTNTSCSTTRPLNWTATTGGYTLDASGGGVGSSTSAYTIAYLNSGAIKSGSGSVGLTLQGSNNGTNTLAQVLNDSGGTTTLKKTGYGQWVVTGANIYSGATTIQQGTLTVNTINSVSGGAASSSLGHPTTVANGTIAVGSTWMTGILNYTGPGETSDRVINLAGTTGGATLMQSGSGPLKFTSNLTSTGAGAKMLTLSGSAAGTGQLAGIVSDNSSVNTTALVKTGTGTWVLSAANTFSGGTVISGGTLSVGADNNLGASPASATNNITLNGGALSASASFALAANRGIALGPNGTNSLNTPLIGNGTLDVASGQTLSYAGTITSGTTTNVVIVVGVSTNINIFTNIGNVSKTGSGTLALSGANTYTGNTTISAGTLALTGSGTIGGSNLVIAAGATFDVSALGGGYALGTGQELVATSGATATVNGSLNVASAAVLMTNVINTATITVNGGTLTLGASTPFTVNVNNGGTPLAAGSYKLISKGTGSVGGTAPSAVTVGGDGLAAGATAALSVSGGELFLVVTGGTPSTPVIGGISMTGGQVSLTFSGTNGTWYVLSATNLTTPLANWITNASGTFGSSGTIVNTNLTPSGPQEFYRIKAQ